MTGHIFPKLNRFSNLCVFFAITAIFCTVEDSYGSATSTIPWHEAAPLAKLSHVLEEKLLPRMSYEVKVDENDRPNIVIHAREFGDGYTDFVVEASAFRDVVQKYIADYQATNAAKIELGKEVERFMTAAVSRVTPNGTRTPEDAIRAILNHAKHAKTSSPSVADLNSGYDALRRLQSMENVQRQVAQTVEVSRNRAVAAKKNDIRALSPDKLAEKFPTLIAEAAAHLKEEQITLQQLIEHGAALLTGEMETVTAHGIRNAKTGVSLVPYVGSVIAHDRGVLSHIATKLISGHEHREQEGVLHTGGYSTGMLRTMLLGPTNGRSAIHDSKTSPIAVRDNGFALTATYGSPADLRTVKNIFSPTHDNKAVAVKGLQLTTAEGLEVAEKALKLKNRHAAVVASKTTETLRNSIRELAITVKDGNGLNPQTNEIVSLWSHIPRAHAAVEALNNAADGYEHADMLRGFDKSIFGNGHDHTVSEQQVKTAAVALTDHLFSQEEATALKKMLTTVSAHERANQTADAVRRKELNYAAETHNRGLRNDPNGNHIADHSRTWSHNNANHAPARGYSTTR